MEDLIKCYCGHTSYCDCVPEEPKQEFPQFGTKEFNDLASAYFSGKPKQETLEEVAIENRIRGINVDTGFRQETLEQTSEIEKIAMDKLKSKWEHLYTFGYPQKPFPTNYENDLNNVKIGLCEGAKWRMERSYSEEDLKSAFFNGGNMKDIEEFNYWFEKNKKK